MSPVSSNQDNEKSIEPNSKSFKNVYEKDHKPTSYLETMMHALKANVGTGCFALGAAFKHGGIILGPILLAVIAIICLHGQQMLVKSADFLREKNNLEVALTYAETVEMSFLNSNSEKWRKWAPAMKKICNVFICLTQFGFCCVYLLFVASNIKEIGDFHGIVWNIHVWITIAVVPIWLSTMIRTLKILAICSTIANISMFIGIFMTVGYTALDLPSFSDQKYVGDVDTLPLFLGIVLFAYSVITLVLPLKNAMEKPEDFNSPLGILNVSIVITTIIYIIVGVLAYWKYEEKILGSVTLNLDNNLLVCRIIKIMVTIDVLLSYAIQFFVPIQVMFPSLAASSKFATKHPVYSELLFRSAMVFLTYIITMAVPNLKTLLSLVGSVCSTLLVFVFPVVCELILTNNNAEGISWWYWLKDSGILLLALAGFLLGGGLNIKEIIEEFMQ